VFSVDIDTELVDSARSRLHEIGFRPTLVTADGAGGLPEHAPFDRIIATCAVPTVPCAWAEQLRVGGTILVDVKVAPEAGNLVLLHPWWDHRVGWLLAQFQGLPADVHIGMHLDPGTRQPTASFLSAPDGSWAAVSLTITPER
jgi:hypothetical protein